MVHSVFVAPSHMLMCSGIVVQLFFCQMQSVQGNFQVALEQLNLVKSIIKWVSVNKMFNVQACRSTFGPPTSHEGVVTCISVASALREGRDRWIPGACCSQSSQKGQL